MGDWFRCCEIVEVVEREYAVGDRVLVNRNSSLFLPTYHSWLEDVDYVAEVSFVDYGDDSPYQLHVGEDEQGERRFWVSADVIVGKVPVSSKLDITPIAQSVIDLYKRFGIFLDAATAAERLNKELNSGMFGAARQLSVATNLGDLWNTDNSVQRTQAAQEFADVLYTLVGFAIALGLKPGNLQKAAEEIVAKNNTKTTTTHYVVIGADGVKKVTRRDLLIIAISYAVAAEYAAGRVFRYITDEQRLIGLTGEVMILGQPRTRSKPEYVRLLSTVKRMRESGEVVVRSRC